MKSSTLILGIFAILFAVSRCFAGDAQTEGPVTFTDPVSYCKAVGAIDAPDARYHGPLVPEWMVAALYTSDEIKVQKDSGADPAS